ncbi:MAG: tetratricopeptide repeat protein [Puniceicoccales bacterium]
MKCCLLILSICFPGFAFSCIWINGVTLDGDIARINAHSDFDRLSYAFAKTPTEKIDEIRKYQAREQDSIDPFQSREQIAVINLLEGDTGQAIEILKTNEEESPGKYSTAANLGTAYELHGDLDSAIEWISEGIRRNPDSHHGTEWLHLRILKTKQALQKDPSYLESNDVVQLPELKTSETIVLEGENLNAEDIQHSIVYQLNERLLFIKSDDPVIANLLETLAEINTHIITLESAIDILELAKSFAPERTAHYDAMIEEYRGIIKQAKFNRMVRRSVLDITIAAGLILFLIYSYKRKWFFLSSVDRDNYLREKRSGRV